jgi:general secretion pathway protein D
MNSEEKNYRVLSRLSLVAMLAGTLAGCASTLPENAFDPLRDERSLQVASTEIVAGVEELPVERKDFPVPGYPDTNPAATAAQEDLAGGLEGEDIQANFRNMPLPEFINQVYANLLGLNVVLDPSLTAAKDLVTLSITEPLAPGDLYRIARTVLAEYGVGIIESRQILRFRRDNEAAQDVPILVSGVALPDVPNSRRPVFSFVSLSVVRNTMVRGWLMQLYKGTPLNVQEDPQRNAIVLTGPFELVKQATETTKMLDQPLMKGKFSRSFKPTYLSVEELTNDLEKVLSAEGYAVSQRPPIGAVIILPLETQERIVAFTGSQETLDHVIEWAYDLDAQKKDSISQGFFSYKAQNVTADHIGQLVGMLKGSAEGGARPAAEPRQSQRNTNSNALGANGNQGTDNAGAQSYLGGKLVVDTNRNVLFFSGSGQEWRELLELIKEVDKPVPMVVIDVLLAEITLGGQQESGVEWKFPGDGTGKDVTGSTFGGLGIGSSGLSLTFDSAGETRAIINAFYSNDRAVIRSSPKLLVKSGEQAFIEVGNEIPIITSNSQSIDSPDAPVIQTIQYRKTGVLLSINPIVQAGGMVDLRITQELSEQATSSASAVAGSPTILTRKVETALALHDGGSVLLGGLISSSKSTGQQGIPGLGKIPLIGRLFRTDIATDTQTELLMLVSVYVIDSHEDAVELTESLRERISLPE